MDYLDIGVLIGLMCSIGFGVFFALIEASLLSLKPMQVRQLKEKNPTIGQPLADVLERPDRLLSITVIGSTASYFAATLLSWVVLNNLISTLSVWVYWILISLALFLFMEVVPKSVALRMPLSMSRRMVGPVKRLLIVLRPLRRLLETVTHVLVSMLELRFVRPSEKLDQHEFETLIAAGRQEGLLKESESRMIQNIVNLGDKLVKDVMTPLVDVARVSDELPRERVVSILQRARHRSIPVYDDEPGRLIGILNAKRYLANPSLDLSDAMEPPLLVPETMKALVLLKQFLEKRQRMALVVDEFGDFSGVVTEGDINEDIFGDVQGDFDSKAWLIEELESGRYLVDGATRLEDLQQEIGLTIQHDGVDTIGGFLLVHMEGHLQPGGSLVHEGVKFTIYKVARQRILQVLVEKERN